MPDVKIMQQVAAEVGYSETVFAAPSNAGYRVRYFAPAKEIPFCGHATIALGAVLASRGEDKEIVLELNEGVAHVAGYRTSLGLGAALRFASTRHHAAPSALLNPSLSLFGWSQSDLDERCPPAIIEAGARHLLLAVHDRQRLAAMRYDMETGVELMNEWQLATISLVQAENTSRYHARNPFASGGVYEDPATGAAAAALVAYLSELGVIGAQTIEVIQGEDMGIPCLIKAEAPKAPGGSSRVSGKVRFLADEG